MKTLTLILMSSEETHFKLTGLIINKTKNCHIWLESSVIRNSIVVHVSLEINVTVPLIYTLNVTSCAIFYMIYISE